jgi:hypothetical protein
VSLEAKMVDISEMLDKLPKCLMKEVFRYVVPSEEDIYFYKYNHTSEFSRYNPKYESARFISDGYPVSNHQKFMLSRIAKKNGKYRYYITRAYTETDGYDSEGYPERKCCYESRYIGKDLNAALLFLYTNDMYMQGFHWDA